MPRRQFLGLKFKQQSILERTGLSPKLTRRLWFEAKTLAVGLLVTLVLHRHVAILQDRHSDVTWEQTYTLCLDNELGEGDLENGWAIR